MLRFASLAILTLTASLTFGCEDKAATPSPEKAAATTADTKPADPEAKTAETPAPSEPAEKPDDEAADEKAADDKAAGNSAAGDKAAGDKAAAKPEDKAAAKPSTADKPVEEKKGAEATGDSFAAYLSGGKYTAGKAGTVTAVLTAKGAYHCNDKYPYKFTLDAAPAGVTYPQTVVKGMSVTEKRSTMAIPFTASEKGAKTISGTLAFSVCNADRCLIEKQKLSITVNVN